MKQHGSRAAVLSSVVLAVALAGCLGPFSPGPGGRDYGIPQFVLVAGGGYSTVPLSPAGHSGLVVDSDVNDDSSLIALAVGGGDLELWASNGTLVTTVTLAGQTDARCGGPWGVIRALDGGKIFTLFDSCARVYGRNGVLESEWGFYGSVRYPHNGISRDGTHLVATDNYTALRVWNLTAGTSVRVDEEANALMDFGITPDGRWLVTVGQEPYGAGTKFYRIDDTNGTATLAATFDRKGHLTFSDQTNVVLQDRWSASGSENEAIMRYLMEGASVQSAIWPCHAEAGSFEKPVCPSIRRSFDAVSPDGRHAAWYDVVAAQWGEEDGTGTVACALVVRVLDFEAPNAMRGFQVGASGSGAMNSNHGNCLNVDAYLRDVDLYLRAWVADDGSAVALSHTVAEPETVHITTAAANATAPFASGSYV